jgi:hypothetical protein
MGLILAVLCKRGVKVVEVAVCALAALGSAIEICGLHYKRIMILLYDHSWCGL